MSRRCLVPWQLSFEDTQYVAMREQIDKKAVDKRSQQCFSQKRCRAVTNHKPELEKRRASRTLTDASLWNSR